VCDECAEVAADEHEYREQTRQEQREADLSTRQPGGEEDYDGYEDWSEDE
jgi:ribosome-binding protein aMBF1 (putative translation factor)